jgi:hypothetical protein
MLRDLVEDAQDLDEVAGRLERCAAMLRRMHRDGVMLVEEDDGQVLRLAAPNAAVEARWKMDDCVNTVLSITGPTTNRGDRQVWPIRGQAPRIRVPAVRDGHGVHPGHSRGRVFHNGDMRGDAIWPRIVGSWTVDMELTVTAGWHQAEARNAGSRIALGVSVLSRLRKLTCAQWPIRPEHIAQTRKNLCKPKGEPGVLTRFRPHSAQERTP